MALKKKWIKKTISVALMLAMALELTACSKKDENAGKENAGLAKEYVYSETRIDMSAFGSEDNFNVQNMQKVNDRIYILASIYTYTDQGSRSNLKLMSMKEDGSDIQTIGLQLPGAEPSQDTDEGASEEAASEEEGSSKEEGTSSGNVTIQPRVAIDAVIEEEGGYESPSRSEWIGFQSAVITKDSLVYVIKRHDINDWSDEENPIYESSTSVCCWDLEGNFKWEAPIENLQTEDYYYYIQNMIPAKDGKVVLLINGEESSKMTVDSEGNVSERTPIKVSGGNSSGNMEMTMVKDDGTLLFTYYDDNYTNMYIATYDITTDTMGEGIKMPDAFYNMGYSCVTAGVDSDIVFANSSGVFSYTMGDTEVKQVMSYINSDMSINSLNQIVMLDDTHFIATYYDPFDYKQQCGLFTKVNAEDIPDKNVLVLGGSYIDTDLKKRVVDFNKSNEKYRITLKEYQMYNTREDYMAGYTQLNNDILAGNMPDILVVDEWGMSVENYVSKGVLADIGALIEKDEELSQKEFMTNVFDAYKVNGKLYQVIPSFYVQTMMGKKSLVGDRTSWTMKDMEEVLAKLPEETQVFGETTKSSFLYNMLEFCGNDYVDVATGKCNFDSQQFIDMLEYANTLPQELSEDYYGDDWWMKYQSQYRENRTLLMYSYIGDFSNLNNQINGYFGEDVSCIGFPTDNGMGSFVGTNGSYVLSAKSKNLEGAWEFIRYYLTDEYQNSMQWGLPVSKTAFMEKSKDATGKDYYIDENGEKVETEEWFEINGESIEIEPLTQEQLDEIVAFIESVTKRRYYNQDIQNIVTEETEAFFSGQKSAAEVAGIIQSRVQLYVNENR